MPKRMSHLIQYEADVALKYQVYSALFKTLPFAEMKSLNAEVLTFQEYCLNEVRMGKSPDEIVNDFFKLVLRNDDFKFKIRILILILQFLERQVVLLDALEDAAFSETHDVQGLGSLGDYLKSTVAHHELDKAYINIKRYHTRIVLTAHPTQFYPLQVLEIIEDLARATHDNDLNRISRLLLQLGKTSFKNSSRPTPVDEAEVHIYYLERIFYPVIKKLQTRLSAAFVQQWAADGAMPTVLQLGFWPGGDRDGNANVTPTSTLTVAKKLRSSILNIYVHEVEKLKRRLTFPNLWPMLDKIKQRLCTTIHLQPHDEKDALFVYMNVEAFIADLLHVKNVLIQQHDGLFCEKIDAVITAARTFGFYFASIDIRQSSNIHTEVLQKIFQHLARHGAIAEDVKRQCNNYLDAPQQDKMKVLLWFLESQSFSLSADWMAKDPILADVIGSLHAVITIQKANGRKGLHRYVISHAHAAYNVIEVLLLAKFAGVTLGECMLDIVPLFETITDMVQAPAIMRELYELPFYQAHLAAHQQAQVVMLGFSDGIKDGGYLMANWAILQCKMNLYQLSNEKQINITFFDGRGGTPARGGGNIHKYYRAMNEMMDQQNIQVTIQGQTITSDFGTKDSASYNIEQLLTAGLQTSGKVLDIFTDEERSLLDKLSTLSYEAYQQLKNNSQFVSYMQTVTPIDFYGELNNASRPPRRHASGDLQVDDLRAIPYIGAWSQIKQIAPVYFGIGTAIKKLIEDGQELALKNFYHHSLYFRTLIKNAMQSLLRTNFLITEYLRNDTEFGEFWNILHDETELTIKMLMRISDQSALLENDPVAQSSIAIRETMVIPLSVIQQYALIEMRDSNDGLDSEEVRAFKQLILKSLAANTNASRNST